MKRKYPFKYQSGWKIYGWINGNNLPISSTIYKRSPFKIMEKKSKELKMNLHIEAYYR